MLSVGSRYFQYTPGAGVIVSVRYAPLERTARTFDKASTQTKRAHTIPPPVLDDEVNVLGALLPPPSQIRTRVTAPSHRRARTMERVAAARGSRVRKLVSSSSSSDADDGSLGEFKAGGTCSYYAPNSENGCSTPRQCFDCLNFQVATETAGCMVNTIGKCVPVTGNYNPADDYTRGVADNANGTTSSGSFGSYTDNPGLLFRADSVDYCGLTDTACAACRTAFVEASNSPNSKKRTTFCYGSGGCVCIAACESTRWSEIVGGKQCPTVAPTVVVLPPSPSPPPPPPPPHGMQGWEITLIVIAVLLAVLIGVILFKRNQNDNLPMWITRIVKKYRKSPEQAPQLSDHDGEATGTPTGSASSQSSGNRAIGGPKREGLSLFGWRTMREELIDNENNKLAILEERSPQSGFVQFADTTPSAPAFEDEHADMPAAATRPTAPSIDM